MLRMLIMALLFVPASALARDWQVDKAKSALAFAGSYQSEAFNGHFGKFEATIAYDPQDLARSKFDVVVDLSSVDTGNGDRDSSLKGADFFATNQFPKTHFVSASFAHTSSGVEAVGQLTIRDQSKPVVLKVGFSQVGDGATLDVDTTLKRAQFNLGSGSDWADIGADVTVHGHLVLHAN